jgi:hypothetical protein
LKKQSSLQGRVEERQANFFINYDEEEGSEVEFPTLLFCFASFDFFLIIFRCVLQLKILLL